MFEILRVYETAKNEKNKLLRKIYMRYTKHKLKKVFFEKFQSSIYNMELDKNLIEEFRQFFNCTPHLFVGSKKSPYMPWVFYISSYGSIYIDYHNYRIRFSFMENNCDIETNVESEKDKTIVMHPEYEVFYSSFWCKIILIAIYNYCVGYVYGEKSDLYIDNKSFLNNITMYF